MTEPQIWTLIGVFAAATFGMIGWQTASFTRTLRTEISSVRSELRTEIGSVRTELRSEIASVRTELRTEIGALREVMDARFTATDAKIENLDRDVQALTRHVFGTGSAAG